MLYLDWTSVARWSRFQASSKVVHEDSVVRFFLSFVPVPRMYLSSQVEIVQLFKMPLQVVPYQEACCLLPLKAWSASCCFFQFRMLLGDVCIRLATSRTPYCCSISSACSFHGLYDLDDGPSTPPEPSKRQWRSNLKSKARVNLRANQTVFYW